MKHQALQRPLALLATLLPAAALAQTGVSDDRVSLPEGPGSLEGVGENVEIDPNMGQMRYSVNIDVPAGYPGMTPGVGLSYSSGSGGSVVGMGWSLAMPNIERGTARGLPEYDVDDGFTVDGGSQLVYVEGTDPRIYRARFESGFVRYKWHSPGDGTEGYWTAEYPDGRVATYGAETDGTLVPDARVSGAGGTFRYHLVEMTDRYDHKIRYDYSTFDGNVTLVQRIGWVHDGNGDPTYYVTFAYDDREDLLSDCKAGFNELLEKKLTRINVFAHGQRLRHYDLSYEDTAESGGFTRLAGVQLYGLDDSAYPVHESFTYSKGLGAQCTGDECVQPYTVSMGSVGVDLQSGDATLLDINGDALPDVIDTSRPGQPHRIFLNVLTDNGDGTFSHAFQLPAVDSGVGAQDSHDLSSPYCQVLDVDGDGFTDLINSQTGDVLRNLGTGDWAEVYSLWSSGDGGAPDLNGDFDPSDGELRTVRFIDYDNDKRIDLIRSVGSGASNTTTVYRNIGQGGFQSDDLVDALGAGFEADNLELNDMNGDGLLDAVQVTVDTVRYRLNLGWGRWEPWVEITGFDFSDQEKIEAELEDLNGDALADLVLVAGNQVRYWLNRNGDSFDPEQVIDSADIDGEIPVRDASVTVLYADMNGNGSSDILWITSSGEATYLELFPVRPNLMSRVENGLGKVTEVGYGTSVEQQARDGGRNAWAYSLPHPMAVVTRYDEWDALTDVHQTTDYLYHDGFYDGMEKQFRGYARVEQHEPGDASSPDGWLYETYDVGEDDPYYNGLLLTSELRQGEDVLRVVTKHYDDCEVADVPDSGLTFDVRRVCLVREQTEVREGSDDSTSWITTEKRTEYDGYGNVALDADLGVTAVGGGACPACSGSGFDGTPCGPQCLGDESYTRTEYAVPGDNGDLWILDRPIRKRTFGVADAGGLPANELFTETLTYYDGEDFVGLALGQLTRGTAKRATARVDTSGTLIERQRSAIDAHGNVIESVDPLGTVGGDDHRRQWTYDDQGLRILRTEVLLKNADGAYRLRRDVQYDPVWDLPVESTAWMVVQDGSPIDPRSSSFYAYDAFGRIISLTRPGESAGMTSEEYSYELGNPTSRFVIRKRSTVGGALDLETVRCFDGHGRKYQERVLVAGDQYQVTGFSVFDTKGEEREVFQPYRATGGQCDAAPPAGTHSVQTYRDALGRIVRQVWPDPEGGTGAVPETRIAYEPLTTISYDLEDTLPQGEFFDTPTVERLNGLGQRIALERTPSQGGQPLVTSFRYDELGNLAGWTDPAGNTHEQQHDLLGRVVHVDNPDRGTITRRFDANGNKVEEVDARGVTTEMAYDGDNRLLAVWDADDETGTRIDYRFDLRGDCPADHCSNVAGRLVGVTYPLLEGQSGEDLHGYDERGNATNFSRQLDGHVFDFASRYDNIGRAVGNVYPNGLEIDFELDGAGRLTAMPGYITSVSYDDRGLLASAELANGVVTDRAYDEQMRMATMTAAKAGGPAIVAYSYERNREGHITRITDDRADDGAPLGGAVYAYDALYRLTEAQLDPDRAAHAETISIAYDAAGDITSKTSSKGADSPAHVGSYTYGENGAGPHAVTTAGGTSFTYDAAGQMTGRGDATYAWDFMGRMTGAEEGGQAVATFAYGSSTDRLIKREGDHISYFVGSGFEVRDGVATIYLEVDEARVVKIEDYGFAATILSDVAPASGADDALVAEPDGAITAGDAWIARAVGTGTMSFATATEVSSPGALLEASVNRLLGLGDTETTSFLHQDHLGGTVAVTDDQGALVERSEFYPFGQIRYESGDGEDYGYTGKEQDRSTGLVYFGARYLDPWTGRWTAPDPSFATVEDDDFKDDEFEATGGYPYSRNNPVNHVDRDGNLANFIIGGIVGAVTSVVSTVMCEKAKGNKILSWKTMGKILLKGAIGFGLGALTSGVSAIAIAGTANVVSGAVEAAEIRRTGSNAEGAKVGAGARIGFAIIGAFTGNYDKVGEGLLSAAKTVGKVAFFVKDAESVEKHGKGLAERAAGQAARPFKAAWHGVKKLGRGIRSKWKKFKTKRRRKKLLKKLRKKRGRLPGKLAKEAQKKVQAKAKSR